jgi:hypothetical protein
LDVIKRNPQGQETWRYRGRLVEQSGSRWVLEAFFDRDDMNLHGLHLGRGDRFVETYFTDRWYNIFEIHGRDDDRLRGWYCNVASPVTVHADTLEYIDLALDLLVFPDGRQLVLDEHEFNALEISPELRSAARQGLAELQEAFRSRTGV